MIAVVVDAKLSLLCTYCQSVEIIQSHQKLKGFLDTCLLALALSCKTARSQVLVIGLPLETGLDFGLIKPTERKMLTVMPSTYFEC